MVSTPLYSNTTLVSVIFPTLTGWAETAVLMEEVRRQGQIPGAGAKANRATHAMLVPVQYRRLMEYAGVSTFTTFRQLRDEILHQRAVRGLS